MTQAPYKLDLPLHTIESAPEVARATLQSVRQQLGLVPNIFGYFANSPALLESYLALDRHFRESSRLSPAEQEVVLLTISRENGCNYCVAVHAHAAQHSAQVPEAVTEALRSGRPLPDGRLDALSRFTQRMVATRGVPESADIEAFHRAGFDDLQILDIILALGLKTLSNYANHLCHTELDPVFEGHRWPPA